MKRLLILLICSILAVPAFSEVYYRIAQKDYYALISEICAKKTNIECIDYAPIVKKLKQEKIDGMQNVLDRLERVDKLPICSDCEGRFVLTDSEWKDIEHLITQFKGKTYDEDMSIIRGKIALLEMEIEKLKHKK